MRYVKRDNQTWPLRTYWARRRWALGRLQCVGNLTREGPYFTEWEMDQLEKISKIVDRIVAHSERSYQDLKDLYEIKEVTKHGIINRLGPRHRLDG